jgi:hypothetical protein
MTFNELEALRVSMNLGVNAFYQHVQLPKSSYYVKNCQDEMERQSKVQMLSAASD